MSEQARGLKHNESGQVAYSALFILLSLVAAGAVVVTSAAEAEVLQTAMVSLAMALVPILIITSSAIWLFGRPADELHNNVHQ